MLRRETVYGRNAKVHADVFEELAHEALLPGQVVRTDGVVIDSQAGESPVGDISAILATIAIEGDDRLEDISINTIQGLALAAFRLGVQAAGGEDTPRVIRTIPMPPAPLGQEGS